MSFPECHSRRIVSKRKPRHVCLHPRMHIADQVVTPEICKMCVYRLQPPPENFRPIPPPPKQKYPYWRPRSVAVIIPCHNYGRYLEEAVESVLRQTWPVDEILIVDDSSTDNTPAVAASLTSAKVRYIRVEHGHSQRTRRSGLETTRSDVVCFLDADDRLTPDYIRKGMDEFANAHVGVVYSDFELFGAKQGRTCFPAKYDRAALSRMNYMHSGSLVLREALEISRGLEVETDDTLTLQDWLLWRRVLDHGWTARKQAGLYLYRKHDQSMTVAWRPWGEDPAEYYHRAGLAAEMITLFIPLSGRIALWPMMADFLERQSWPHDQVRLILMDTSQSAAFSKTVRRWLAECDYADARHVREAVGSVGLADRPRRMNSTEVCLSMARIYNRLAGEAATDFVWVVEDDIGPPLDACDRLLRGFDTQTASVSATYRSRFADVYVAWDADGRPIPQRGEGLRPCGGNGFGCVVLRSEVVRDTPFTATIDADGFDVAFYHRLPQTGLKAKIDWSVECNHVEAACCRFSDS